MKHILPVVVVATLLALALAGWTLAARHPTGSRHLPLQEVVHSLATNPVVFAKSHFVGGLGINVSTDPKTGLPLVGGVAAESPADRAGICDGDLILKVDGLTTKGKPLAQVAADASGIAGGMVTLVMQRGSTNYERAVQRVSRHRLQGMRLKTSPYE